MLRLFFLVALATLLAPVKAEREITLSPVSHSCHFLFRI